MNKLLFASPNRKCQSGSVRFPITRIHRVLDVSIEFQKRIPPVFHRELDRLVQLYVPRRLFAESEIERKPINIIAERIRITADLQLILIESCMDRRARTLSSPSFFCYIRMVLRYAYELIHDAALD